MQTSNKDMTVGERLQQRQRETQDLALQIIDQKEAQIQDLKKQKEQLRKMIDTAIGLAYDKDNDEAMDYLINEKDHYPELRD